VNLTQNIIQFLQILQDNCANKTDSLQFSEKSAKLLLNQIPLITIDENYISLFSNTNLQEKITLNSALQKSQYIDFKKFEEFCSQLDLVKVNHLGISYSCPNIDEEIKFYKTILKDTKFKLYEETSGNPYNRWFFIGNTKHWEDPMFELVLSESKSTKLDDWTPHFQIDFDTYNSYNDLKKYSNKYLGEEFFSWTLTEKEYGTILAMGKLAEINGTKIYLGLRTNLRDNRYHKLKILKEI